MPIAGIALNFVLNNKYIDKVVIGVTKLVELRENIDFLRLNDYVLELHPKLTELAINDEELILPMNWNK